VTRSLILNLTPAPAVEVLVPDVHLLLSRNAGLPIDITVLMQMEHAPSLWTSEHYSVGLAIE
jgi:hypothetical protein